MPRETSGAMHRSSVFLVVVAGWIAVTVSIVIPLMVVLASWAQTRDLRCTEEFEYTFVPLLVTCGPRTAGQLALGGGLTALALGCVVIALTAMSRALVRIRNNADTGERFQVRLIAVTLAVDIGLVVCVRALNPDSIGINAWILPAMFGAGLVTAASATWATVVATRSPAPGHSE